MQNNSCFFYRSPIHVELGLWISYFDDAGIVFYPLTLLVEVTLLHPAYNKADTNYPSQVTHLLTSDIQIFIVKN